MASGLAMCRINRPNIWLHRPAKFTKNTLAKTEPSTYGPTRTHLPSAELVCLWGLSGCPRAWVATAVHDPEQAFRKPNLPQAINVFFRTRNRHCNLDRPSLEPAHAEMAPHSNGPLQSPFTTRLGGIAGRGKPAVRPAST